MHLPSTNITFPKATKLLLMLAPSRNLDVPVHLLDARSLPAKSTKWSLVPPQPVIVKRE